MPEGVIMLSGGQKVMMKLDTLSAELTARMKTERATGTYPRTACPDSAAVYRYGSMGIVDTGWRSAYARDTEMIMHCPFYNRYSDKTQVFSFVKNDDVSHRMLHVQLVSRIARTIGAALNLKTDLIEAIALGHDMGHTPFAHAGERFLDEISFARTGRHFCHAAQSARVLDRIYPYNITLQTLTGLCSHNFLLDREKYVPEPIGDFAEFDRVLSCCEKDRTYVTRITPTTLEAIVVRISDIIAYLGKDREDALRAGFIREDPFQNNVIGASNTEIVNNLAVNLIENSYGKPYIRLDRSYLDAMMQSRQENYAVIYNRVTEEGRLAETVRPMMAELYERLFDDLVQGRKESPIFTHHIAYVERFQALRGSSYGNEEPDRIVTDYIASMTDDYFLDLYRYFFPWRDTNIRYQGYFD